MSGGRLHFILGGARSGKSARAQSLALQAEARGASVCVIATAWAADDEMRERIARHRAERPASWRTVELGRQPRALADALAAPAQAQACMLVDCLTLWMSQLICPPPGIEPLDVASECTALLDALAERSAPTILVSNDIGSGVIPLGAASRRVVDELGSLHQRIAARADEVTLMVAGLPLSLKGPT